MDTDDMDTDRCDPIGRGWRPDPRDEAAVRGELTRVFTTCASCRRCVDLCDAFPRLFDVLDDAAIDDPGLLTPVEQDRIVDGCHQCDRCTAGCPYAPGRHDDAVDVALTMSVAKSMQRVSGHRGTRERLGDMLLDPVGRLGAVVGRLTDGGRRGWSRPLAGPLGVTAAGLPRRRAARSFSAWFAERPSPPVGTRPVVLLPSCVVEHHDPDLGADVVEVLEAVGAEVTLASASCCGARWLRLGDIDRFAADAETFVIHTAEQLRSGGRRLVVPHPTCAHAIVERIPDVVGAARRADAEFVAGATTGVAEFVLGADDERDVDGHRATTWRVPAGLAGTDPPRVVFATSCHGRTIGSAEAAAELLGRVGIEVTRVDACPGVGGSWGLRTANAAVAVELGSRADQRYSEASTSSGADGAAQSDPWTVGDCPDANEAVFRRTGVRPVHVASFLAGVIRDGRFPRSPDRRRSRSGD
jgi:Fe-S oxidoreductase